MSLFQNLFPHRCGRNYWDVWDWPQSVRNQNFGLDLDDFMTDGLRPSLFLSIPQRQQLAQRSGVSDVTNNPNKFEIKLDCSHFKPQEITVKTVDNYVVINGKHEEKMDRHGWVSREFSRRYALPEGVDAEQVTSSLTSNGVLCIEAPKKAIEAVKENERVVPIAVQHEDSPNAIQN